MAQFYEEGNKYFQEHRYEAALDAYSKALIHSESPALNLKLHLNVSICALKLRLYEEAVKASTNALEIDPKNMKALIRRSSAREYMGDFKKSLADLHFALEYSPSSLCPSITRDIRRLSCMLEKDTAVLEDGGVWEDLIRPGQALRLMFVEPPPRIIKVDDVYKAKVCIGSEFGLWDKGNMQSKDDETVPVFIQCKISFTGESQTFHELTFASDIVKIGQDGKATFSFKISRVGCSDTLPGDIPFILSVSCSGKLPSGTEVLSVSSLPCLVSSSDGKSSTSVMQLSSCDIMTLGSSLGAHCIREVNILGHLFYALECPGYLGIGGKVWDSTFILLKYLSEPDNRDLISGKRVIELGSGTAIAGVALSALYPSSVTLTDLPEVAPLSLQNMKLNSFMCKDPELAEILKTKYSSCEYIWGEAPPADPSNFDVIVASDVVYDPIGYEPLYLSLRLLLGLNTKFSSEILPQDRKLCILAHRHRHPEDHKFFDMITADRDILMVEMDWKDQAGGCATAISEISRQAEDRAVAAMNDGTSFQDIRIFHLYASVSK